MSKSQTPSFCCCCSTLISSLWYLQLPLLTQYLSVSVDHGEKSFAFTPLSSGSIIPNLAEPLIRRLSSKAIVATAIKSLVSNDGRSGSFSSLEVLRDTHSEPPTVSREAVLEVASILAHFLELEFYLERCDGSRKYEGNMNI